MSEAAADGASNPDAPTAVTMRLRADATFADGAIVLPTGPIPLPGLSPGLTEALTALAAGDRTEAEVSAAVTGPDGMAGLMRLQLLLRKLNGGGLLEHAVSVGDREVARLRPVGRGAVDLMSAAPAEGPVKLSRFVSVRADGGALVAGHPRNPAVVLLTAEVLGALADWLPTGQVGAAAGLPAAAVGPVLRLLGAAGLLVTGGPEEDPEHDDVHAGWAPTDLWLHARSRGIRLSARYGGSYPFADRFPPPPGVPPRRDTERVVPAVPDLDVLTAKDPSLTEVLEKRRSVRAHDPDRSITADELGELLYRATRVRRTFVGADRQELLDRPYPSGGSLGELEIYPLVTQCEGLSAGLWHYTSGEHGFERVADAGPATAALVSGARASALMTADPQVVLIVTARFGRVTWKYETIAYSLMLKHVGVLYQTLYLVGTAMGLGVCGLGGGDADSFAAASGIDYWAEGSVGELVVGSRPADDGASRP